MKFFFRLFVLLGMGWLSLTLWPQGAANPSTAAVTWLFFGMSLASTGVALWSMLEYLLGGALENTRIDHPYPLGQGYERNRQMVHPAQRLPGSIRRRTQQPRKYEWIGVLDHQEAERGLR